MRARPYVSFTGLERRRGKVRAYSKIMLISIRKDSNLAFRAVNQCIGRAIRHRNDWSSILLLGASHSSLQDVRATI